MSDVWSKEFEEDVAALMDSIDKKLVEVCSELILAYVKPEQVMLDRLLESLKKEVDVLDGGRVQTEAEPGCPVAVPVVINPPKQPSTSSANQPAAGPSTSSANQPAAGRSTCSANQPAARASRASVVSGSSPRGGTGGRRGRVMWPLKTQRQRQVEAMVTSEWEEESSANPAPQLPNYDAYKVQYFERR